jgi:hypothetical protein
MENVPDEGKEAAGHSTHGVPYSGVVLVVGKFLL